MVKLNIGVLQLNPRIGNVCANIEQANNILRKHGYHVPFPYTLGSFSNSSSSSGSNSCLNTSSAEDNPNHVNSMNNSSGNTNVNKVNTSHSPITARIPIDILVLPELAFTGYNFSSRAEIKPYLEPTTAGVSTDWAKHVSKALGCHVLVGYPEKFINQPNLPKNILDNTATNKTTPTAEKSQLSNDVMTKKQTDNLSAKTESDEEENYTIYNSAVMVSPLGNVVFNYRKSFLYSADEAWGCSESPDMKNGPNSPDTFPLTGTIMIQSTNGSNARESLNDGRIPLKVQVGICMDLNPYKFEAPFERYEFANAAARNDASLVLCPTAWLHTESPDMLKKEDYEKEIKESLTATLGSIIGSGPKSYEDTLQDRLKALEETLKYSPETPNESTYRYWYLRMIPFFAQATKKRVGLVLCNRSGIEGFTAYAGSSTIFASDLKHKQVGWYGSLGQGSEDLMVRQIEIDP